MEAIKIIQQEKDKLNKLIEGFVIEEVKKLFKRHKNLVKFTDEMGVIYFTDNKGNTIDLVSQVMNKSWTYNYVLTYKNFKNLDLLYTELDNRCLGITINRE